MRKLFAFIFVLHFNFIVCDEVLDPNLNISQIFKKFGYPFEEHEIETEDGYLLGVFRIPHGQKEINNNYQKIPVLLVHGLLGSAENWMYLGPNRSLSYLLADNGYDVWMLNCRGTMHSRKHRSLDPNGNNKFWHFSWHEIGIYDLPATIDYILEKTNQQKFFYIGHSQGMTSFFVMASQKPEYNEKIQLTVGLAPPCFMDHMKNSILRAISPHYLLLDRIALSLNQMEFVPFVSNRQLRSAGRTLCDDFTITKPICTNIFSVVAGADPDQLDKSIIPYVISTFPAGASIRQLLHYAQSIISGEFRQYDFGPKKNLKLYNSTIPPDYPIEKITAPIALIYADSDEFATKIDVERLARILPNLVEVYRIPYGKFTHNDFVLAKDLKPLLNDKIIQLVQEFS